MSSAAAVHPYGTRRSHNLPNPCRGSLPVHDDDGDQLLPVFPPQHVVLHDDDATSKVFLAIGRAFLSVDNRAMTIKDLAERVLSCGLVAQNLSAASQAITTYIRSHLHRCESQQDIPLLLRHVLSGTDVDDHLLPALYSTSGGAQSSVHPHNNRVTNFRRGTMVWYLSRATGAPCPFARAGIRLCDYGENSSTPQSASRSNKKLNPPDHHESCGQKRKRSLRSAYAATPDSPPVSDHGSPPPKVKLTLRLKPLTNLTISPDPESDASMSTDNSDSQQPDLSRSISPLYFRSPSLTHSVSSPPPESDDDEEEEDDDDEGDDDDDDDDGEEDEGEEESDLEEEESDLEEVFFTHSTHNFYSFSEDQGQDWDGEGPVDSEADGNTLWESPGPRSPSASFPETKVKEEPKDVQGMLDAWDHFDSSVADAKVVQVIAQAAAVLNPNTIPGSTAATSPVKIESLDPWDWEPPGVPHHQQEWTLGMAEETIQIKQEELDLGFDSLFSGLGKWQDQDSQYRDTVTQRAKTAPLSHALTLFPDSSSSSSATSSPLSPRVATPMEPISTTSSSFPLPPGLIQLIQVLSVQSPTTPTVNGFSQPHDPPVQSLIPPPPVSIPPSSLVLVSTSSTFPVQQPCVSPQTIKSFSIACKDDAEGIVVHACQPCNPPISATQIEEISVYQMVLGPYLLLRRIDTDFVNLTPIVEWCGKGKGYPVMSTVPNAVVIGKGQASEKVVGVWVPLQVAQGYVRDLDTYPVETETMEGLHVFLHDELVEWFPSTLKDFYRTNSSGRMLKQFGRWFESMLVFAQATATASTDVAAASCIANGPLNPQEVIQADMRQNWMQKETVVPMIDPFPLGDVLTFREKEKLAAGSQSFLHRRQDLFSLQLHRQTGSESKQADRLDCESPLSAKEQEMFHELCVIPGEEEERMKVEEVVDNVEMVVEKKEEEDIPKIVVSSGDGGVVNMLAAENDDAKPALSSPELFKASVQQVPSLSLSLSEADVDGGAASKTKPIAVRTRSMRTAATSKVNEKQEQEKPQMLRRSKRVAAVQIQQEKKKARTRKKTGLRNALS